jgi:hypothetical protein
LDNFGSLDENISGPLVAHQIEIPVSVPGLLASDDFLLVVLGSWQDVKTGTQ